MPRIKNFLLRKESTNMLSPLPKTAHEFMTWSWAQVEPYFKELESRPLTPQDAPEWLADWTQLSDLINETHSRLNVATSVDTTDKEAVDESVLAGVELRHRFENLRPVALHSHRDRRSDAMP